MPVTPRSRSGTASASTSPFKSNGRKQPARKTIELSEDEEIDEKKPARGRPSKAQTEEIDLVDDDDDEDDDATEEYEVETIRRHRPLKGDERYSMEYLIKWKGWSDDDNTWEPEAHIPRNIIDEYWKKQPSKSQPKKFQERQKRKADDDEDDEEIEVSDDEDMKGKVPARNGRRASAASSKRSSPAKSTPKRGSPAKKRRTSTSSRRATQSDDEDHDDSDVKSVDSRDPGQEKALNKIKDRFLDHFMKQKDWEDLVETIINMQRNHDDSRLETYVQFTLNDAWLAAMKKVHLEDTKYAESGPQIWVDNAIVNKRCPQKVIKFYEQHVRFAHPRPAH